MFDRFEKAASMGPVVLIAVCCFGGVVGFLVGSSAGLVGRTELGLFLAPFGALAALVIAFLFAFAARRIG